MLRSHTTPIVCLLFVVLAGGIGARSLLATDPMVDTECPVEVALDISNEVLAGTWTDQSPPISITIEDAYGDPVSFSQVNSGNSASVTADVTGLDGPFEVTYSDAFQNQCSSTVDR